MCSNNIGTNRKLYINHLPQLNSTVKNFKCLCEHDTVIPAVKEH